VVQKVLQNLLRERVSIRDMVTVIEALADHAVTTKSPEILTEFVRQALSRLITKQYTANDGKLYVMMLDQEIEELVTQAVQYSEQGTLLALEPSLAGAFSIRCARAWSSSRSCSCSRCLRACRRFAASCGV